MATPARTARASSDWRSRSPRRSDSTPSDSATWSSQRCCTTSARSRSPRRSSTSPASSTPQEWQVIKTHTIEGQKVLDRVGGFMHQVGLIVRSHHERWDGTGYPDGLAGEAIPLESRIIGCCDAWNAMRTDRVYRASTALRGRTRRAHSQRRTPVRPTHRRRAPHDHRARHRSRHRCHDRGQPSTAAKPEARNRMTAPEADRACAPDR